MSIQTKSIYSVLILLCCICYYESLNGEFVFDDQVAIKKNIDVYDTVSPTSNWYSIFHHDFWGYNLTDKTSHKSYRPLTTLMFRLEYGHFKLKSFEMKLINLLIHCVNSCLVYKLFMNLTQKIELSFFGSILFAVHPIHVEAVSGIVGRADLIFCLFFLWALLIFGTLKLNQQMLLSEWLKLLLLAVIAGIGLLFKETAIMILPSCIYYDIVLRTNLFHKLDIRFHVKKIVIKRFAILLVTTLLLLLFRLYLQDFEAPKFKPMDNPIASNDSIIVRILSQNFLYVLNFWILLCPQWLCFDWAVGCLDLLTSIFDYRFIAIILMYYCLYKLIKTHSRIIYLSLGIIILPFLPASGVVRVGFVIAERILYVPSIGYCLFIAHGHCLIKTLKYKKIVNVLSLLLIIILMLRTRQRSVEWKTEITLFSSGLNVCPNNAKVHYNIAKLAADRGEIKLAFKHYHKAIELYSDYEAASMNLGNLYREIGDYDAAENYLRKSVEILEEFPAAWMNLGIVQAHTKRYDEALISYQKALSYRKRYPICLYNLGNLYLELKNFSEAIKHWQESVILNPRQPKAWANILTLLDNQGLYEEALKISERALQYLNKPEAISIQFIRANLYGKLKNYIQAEQIYLNIIELRPTNAMYRTNLGVLYHLWEKYDLAEKYYKNALSLDSNAKTAKDNLQKLIQRKEKVKTN